MRIFHSYGSNPVLLDTNTRLNMLHHQLHEFLSSSAKDISIQAMTTLSPEPYEEFLKGLRIKKTNGKIMLSLSQDRWLELSGATSNLFKYVEHFKFENEDDHHHPDHANYMSKGSMSLIIEADSTWPNDNEGN